MVLGDGRGLSGGQTDGVLLELLSSGGSEGSSEHILVLLLWEVHIIVSMWVRILSWVVSVIFPGGVGPEVLWMAITPVLDLEVGNRFTLVVVADSHGSLIGLVVNSLGSKEPLSLLSETLKDVIWANLHDGDLLVEASLLAGSRGASLILSNLSVATLWNVVWLKSHELGHFHVWVALTSILVSEGLSLSIWVPVIVHLIMSMILVERII